MRGRLGRGLCRVQGRHDGGLEGQQLRYPRRGSGRARRSDLEPGITDRYCSPSFETATLWPPQDEVQLVETQQPHAEERATRASRSMGSKRLTDLSLSVLDFHFVRPLVFGFLPN